MSISELRREGWDKQCSKEIERDKIKYTSLKKLFRMNLRVIRFPVNTGYAAEQVVLSPAIPRKLCPDDAMILPCPFPFTSVPIHRASVDAT
jgi:ribosome biogenesis protein Tsr3